MYSILSMSTRHIPDLLNTMRTLHIIRHQLDVIFDRVLQDEFGLTLARFRILTPLIEFGPITQSEVARFNLVTEASIGRQVRLLIETGYVERAPSDCDARKYNLMLTAKTKKLLEHITARVQTELTKVYGEVTAAEFVTLSALLTKLQALGTAHTKGAAICTG